METVANQSKLATSAAHNLQSFPPLDQITRPTVPTEQAAYYLNRKPQTLRAWACFENGLIKPIRLNGRLAWPVDVIRKLLGNNVLEGGE